MSRVPPPDGSAPATDRAPARSPRALVVLHLFYGSVWPDFVPGLTRLGRLIPYDLVVTRPEGFPLDKAVEAIRRFKPDAVFRAFPNRGFDVGAFCQIVRETDLAAYDAIFKLQTKRDVRPQNYYGHYFRGSDWRRVMISSLLGPRNVRRTLRWLLHDPSCGLVCAACLDSPDDYDFGRELTLRRMAELGLGEPRRGYHFVKGSTFAVRPEALRFLQRLDLGIDRFPETRRGCFTLAHELERIIPTQIANEGWTIRGTCAAPLLRLRRLPASLLTSGFRGDRVPHQPYVDRNPLPLDPPKPPSVWRAIVHFLYLRQPALAKPPEVSPPDDPFDYASVPDAPFVRWTVQSREVLLSARFRALRPDLAEEIAATMHSRNTVRDVLEPGSEDFLEADRALREDAVVACIRTIRETTLFRERDGVLTIEKRVSGSLPPPFYLEDSPEEPLFLGEYVWPRLAEAFRTGGPEALRAMTADYCREVFAALPGPRGRLAPEALDAVPHNAIRTRDGLRFFDLNLRIRGGIDKAWFVYRTAQLDLADRFRRQGLPPQPVLESHEAVCRLLGIRPDTVRCRIRESALRNLFRPNASRWKTRVAVRAPDVVRIAAAFGLVRA